MRHHWPWLVGLALVGSAAAFAGTRSQPPPAWPTPTPAAGIQAPDLLADSLARWAAVQSFRFRLAATYDFWGADGQLITWRFEGQGAMVVPDKYQWLITGPADTVYQVSSVGGQTRCADARGQRSGDDCTLAWGGLGVGSSPYTLLAYLKYPAQVRDLGDTRLDTEVHHLAFVPDLAKVAALDAAHARAVQRLTEVAGEVWIDRATKMPMQQTVAVRFRRDAGREETVTTTLVFTDYGQPVDIRLPGR